MLIAVTDDGKYTFVSIYSRHKSSTLTGRIFPNRTQHSFFTIQDECIFEFVTALNTPRPGMSGAQSVDKPWVVKGRLPLKLIPALTACTSERMKTFRFRGFAGLPPGAMRGNAVKTTKSGDKPLFRHYVARPGMSGAFACPAVLMRKAAS